MFHDGRYDRTNAILELMMAIVPSSRRPLANKWGIFGLFLPRASQKMPKSPRTSTPGERKALRSKAWSEETELYSICKMKNGIGFWKMKIKVNIYIFRLCFITGPFLETAPNQLIQWMY